MIGLTDSSDDNESKQVPALASTPSSVPSLSGDETSPGDTADGPIAELADPGWVSRTASATGIPARALAAYAGASLSANRTHTGCSIGWNTLAAIGGVESAHGSLNGAILNDDGTVGPEIIGVALDGDGVAKITDTDNGDLDGDTTWDRAVGPMQFLPSTWDAYAVDGNDDGLPDIHNIDDAALSAAGYLCTTGGDLTQPDDWVKAISAYNAGTDYNARVSDLATTYAGAADAG
ncbi:MAG: lytic transglycosylase domain-containing protein [Nocardioidaceae bacterium]|nr:MAG: lytic transglycosylase domain-containing protein [Nocardioidaceae bacterium]